MNIIVVDVDCCGYKKVIADKQHTETPAVGDTVLIEEHLYKVLMVLRWADAKYVKRVYRYDGGGHNQTVLEVKRGK